MTATAETANGAGTIELFIGRQPIFDDRMRVVAYELLFRDGTQNQAKVVDGERATARVVSNAFMELGFETVTGKHPAFVNMTREFLLNDFPRLFPPDRMMLEVLEDVLVDERLLDAIRGLKRDGYRIALDDFVFREQLASLVELADVVKVDIRAHTREGLTEQVRLLKPFGVRPLAEKVETHEELEVCKKLGFQWFQGYFLEKPQVLTGTRPPANRLAILRLLARINDPRADLDDIEGIVSTDVALSYKLLRYINSALFSTTDRVQSIRHALVYLGIRMVRAWVNLVILAGIVDKPHELIVTGMLRAKMCERLAVAAGNRQPDSAFTVGLFSILDALMDVPMGEILHDIPLAEDLVVALRDNLGPFGEFLACTLSFERGQWDGVCVGGLTPRQIQNAFNESLKWQGALSAGLA